MKNRTRHTGILENIQRLPSSKNGNPRYSFTVDGYTARTAPDSSYGYSIRNHEGKRVEVVLGTYRGLLTLDYLKAL